MPKKTIDSIAKKAKEMFLQMAKSNYAIFEFPYMDKYSDKNHPEYDQEFDKELQAIRKAAAKPAPND